MNAAGKNRGITSPRYAYVVCCAGMMSLAIAINLLPVFLTTLQNQFGSSLTSEQLGWLGTVTFVGVVIALLGGGPLADRFGAKVFTVLGSALVAAGLAWLSLALSYGSLLLACLLMGLGAGSLDMVLSPIVAAVQPHRRSAAMNWLHSFYCVGAVATVLLASWALRQNIGWRTLSLSLAAMPLVVLVAFAVMYIPPLVAEESDQSAGRHRLRELLRVGYFWAALAAIFLGGATEVGLAYWLPAYAEQGLGFSKWTGGMALTGFSIAMAVGRIAVGMKGAQLDGVQTMLYCCGSSVLFFLVACFAPWPAVALWACILAGLAGSALWPTMLGVAADRFPRGGASMFGLLAASGNLGGILMPWLVGFATDRGTHHWTHATAMRLGLSTAILCPLFMGLILLRLRKPAPAADESADISEAPTPL